MEAEAANRVNTTWYSQTTMMVSSKYLGNIMKENSARLGVVWLRNHIGNEWEQNGIVGTTVRVGTTSWFAGLEAVSSMLYWRWCVACTERRATPCSSRLEKIMITPGNDQTREWIPIPSDGARSRQARQREPSPIVRDMYVMLALIAPPRPLTTDFRA